MELSAMMERLSSVLPKALATHCYGYGAPEKWVM